MHDLLKLTQEFLKTEKVLSNKQLKEFRDLVDGLHNLRKAKGV